MAAFASSTVVARGGTIVRIKSHPPSKAQAIKINDEFFTMQDELTDQSLRVLVAEIVREKVLQVTGDEIPYVTAVMTERFEEVREDFTRINCVVVVERLSQKKIVIGRGASRLKEIGIRARRDIEELLGHRVHLELFVKVEEDWRNSPHLLDEFGVQ